MSACTVGQQACTSQLSMDNEVYRRRLQYQCNYSGRKTSDTNLPLKSQYGTSRRSNHEVHPEIRNPCSKPSSHPLIPRSYPSPEIITEPPNDEAVTNSRSAANAPVSRLRKARYDAVSPRTVTARWLNEPRARTKNRTTRTAKWRTS
jgi:hypothetical protein